MFFLVSCSFILLAILLVFFLGSLDRRAESISDREG